MIDWSAHCPMGLVFDFFNISFFEKYDQKYTAQAMQFWGWLMDRSGRIPLPTKLENYAATWINLLQIRRKVVLNERDVQTQFALMIL